jgi:hypothetical protein
VARGGLGGRMRFLSHFFVNYQGVNVSKASARGTGGRGTSRQVVLERSSKQLYRYWYLGEGEKRLRRP